MTIKPFKKYILCITRQKFHAAENIIAQESLVLNPGETVSINENGTNFVRRTVYSWCDKAGRQTVQADYGSGTSIWTNAVKPVRPENVPENSTAEYLVLP